MTVEATSTFEQDTPHRPGEGDILNGTKENATASVPAHMPAAEEFMQMARLLVALGSMVPVVRISVAFSGGTPSIHSFTSVRQDLDAGDFTVTDNGAGDTSITWAAGTFPAAVTRPHVSINAAAVDSLAPDVVNITNGVRIRTESAAGAAADRDFTVSVY